MTATRQDVELAAGSDKILEVTITDEAGQPLDLSGLTAATWSVLDRETAQVILQHTLAGSIVVTDPVAGKLQVRLVPADTVDLAGLFEHQLRTVDAANNSAVVTTGTLNIKRAA